MHIKVSMPIRWLNHVNAQHSRQLRTRNVEQVRAYASQSLELLGIQNADELPRNLADDSFAKQWLDQFRTTWSDQTIESISLELEEFVRRILSKQDGQ